MILSNSSTLIYIKFFPIFPLALPHDNSVNGQITFEKMCKNNPQGTRYSELHEHVHPCANWRMESREGALSKVHDTKNYLSIFIT